VRRLLLLALLGAMLAPRPAGAHEVRPGYLDLTETSANLFDMTWKVPALGAFHLAIEPRFPDFCHIVGAPIAIETGGAFLEHGELRCERGLEGSIIEIEGLEATVTNVLVRVAFAEGAVQTALLSPRAPGFTVAVKSGPLQVFGTYLQLGVEHILTGVDHLLFVLCLILLVRSVRKLLATVTAFTVAHSITLAAATLGLVKVPAAPVEASIALSIVFLASELLRAPTARSDVTRSYPWLVAFSFGLLHGLGFAGALAEIGLPHGEIPLALFSFNVGVELGQLAFIAVVLLLNYVARRLVERASDWASRATAYAIGCTAAYWVFQRLAAGLIV
jgi:hydrogenase/urease accessory protein HupE